MCGIAGFSISEIDSRNVNSKKLAKDLLLGIEHRGRDATGFAFIDSTGKAQIHKGPQKASDFVRRGLCMPKRATSAVLHTRAWTQGDPRWNENNHPIAQGTLVGVHNGWLTNDHHLWGDVIEMSRRQAEVDSEVIFAMLAHGMEDSKTDTLGALEKIKGNAAVAWLDSTDPDKLMLARAHGSPLWVGQTTGGSVVFASEEDVVISGCKVAGLDLVALREVNEGNFLTVVRGDIADVRTFDPTGPQYASRSWTSYKGSRTATTTLGRSYGVTPLDDSLDEYDFEGHRTAQLSLASGFKSAEESARAFVAEIDGILGDETVEANWWSPMWMSKKYFSLDTEPPFSSPEDNHAAYYNAHEEREAAIDEWFNTWQGAPASSTAVGAHMCAFTRPGDYVVTTVGNELNVDGQVMEVPSTFPQGMYLLRCFMPRVGKPGEMDIVLIERHFSDFRVKKPMADPSLIVDATVRSDLV